MSCRRNAVVACSPRAWLSRRAGECAFPVDGEGGEVRSCCNPCPGAVYCAGHLSKMKEPAAPSFEQFVAELGVLGICD